MSATPILDLDQPLPAPARSLVSTLIGLGTGMILGAILISADKGLLPKWHWLHANGLLLIPALYIAIAFHEVGHLLAAKLAGLKIGGISVGPFVFSKSGSNWVFRFDRSRWIGGFFKPLSSDPDFSPSQYAACVAGGPIASILLTVLLGIINARYGSGEWSWTGSLFWMSLFILLTAAIPYSAGLNKSDAARLWQFIRYPERARSWIAILNLQTEEANGVRPREWNFQTLEQIIAIDSSANEFLFCQLMAFYRCLDGGSEIAALSHLENVLSKSARVGVALRQGLFLEAASASAIIRKQAVQARTWRERACKLRKPESLDVVDAAIAMCEGRYPDAVKHWQAARNSVDRRRLDSGLIRFAKEKWAGYEAVCRAERQ